MKVITPYCPYCLDQTETTFIMPPVDLEVLDGLACDCPKCKKTPWMDLTPACHNSLFQSQFCPIHGVIMLICDKCRTVAFTLAIAEHWNDWMTSGLPKRETGRPAAPDHKSDTEPTPRSAA